MGYIQIQVLPNGVAQQLQRAELVTAGGRPNRVVDEINKTLTDLRLTNLVTAGTTSGADGAAQLQCQLALEGRFTSGVLSKVRLTLGQLPPRVQHAPSSSRAADDRARAAIALRRCPRRA